MRPVYSSSSASSAAVGRLHRPCGSGLDRVRACSLWCAAACDGSVRKCDAAHVQLLELLLHRQHERHLRHDESIEYAISSMHKRALGCSSSSAKKVRIGGT